MSVDGAAARLALGPGASASVLAGAGSARDVRADAAVRLDQVAGNTYFAFILRYQSDGSMYRGRMELDSAGLPTLAVSRVNGRSETSLAHVKLGAAITPGTWYTLSYTVTGQSPVSIRATLTKRGTTAQPQLTTTDSSDARITGVGRVGLWGYTSRVAAKSTILRLDNLIYTDGTKPLDSKPTPTPTPVVTSKPVPTPKPTTTASATPTPTPTPAPTTTQAPTPPAQPTLPAQPAPASGAAGSVDVGKANYPVPSGALFVDSRVSGDGNGSASSPFKTLQAAIAAAQPGATIVLRAGVYHEAVSVPSNKPLTIQSYPREAVWFDGSRVVANWTKSGSVWVSAGWTASFDSTMKGQASMYVGAAYPNASRPDQLFVDGAALTQVASPSQVVAGTFAVDDANDRLILGTDPAGHDVRASDLSQAFDVTSANTTLQGFGVRRYATTFGATAQVRMHNTGAIVRNLVIEDGAFIGLAVQNDDSVIDHVTARRNGLMGIGVNQAYGLVLKNSLVTGNNTEHFNDTPVAGGIKITRTRDVTVSGNIVSDNIGSGIWFDESCWNIKAIGNTTNNNTATGIQFELSDTAIVAGNTSIGSRTGIQIIDTGNVRIYNNDLGSNADNGVRLRQDERRSATHSTGRDPRMGIDPAVPWITRNITISNNAFGAGGGYSIRANDSATGRAVDSWNVTITGNLFNNKAMGGPTMVAWGKGDNKSFEAYQSPADLAAAKNSSWKNSMTDSALDISAMTPAIKAGSSIAAPLPSDIANALGVGTDRRFIGAYPR